MRRWFGRPQTRAAGYRVFFATDVHGSERCFRKFLNAAQVYGADALILGGDTAGKAIVPMTRLGDGKVSLTYDGAVREFAGAALDEAIGNLEATGFYPRYLESEERQRLADDVPYRERLFEEIIVEQTRAWCTLAAERLAPEVRCVITPGNDDPPAMDEVLRSTTPRVESPERALLELGPILLASLGNTNPTPWHTAREYPEQELAAQIEEMLRPAPEGARLVFNFHAPPYRSGLDRVTQLDEILRPVLRNGAPVEIPVGSTAVREAIERVQPTVGLHGHIHESAGTWHCGRTICLNPGSEYGTGVLKGALVQFDAAGSYKSHLLTTG